jgi:hypothetical protein
LSIKEAIETWRFLGDPDEEILQPWRATWLPLFANGAGDHLCVDLEKGALIEYRHDDAKPVKRSGLPIPGEPTGHGLASGIAQSQRASHRASPSARGSFRSCATRRSTHVHE